MQPNTAPGPAPRKVRTCEVCGLPLYSGTDTRCKRCMDASAVQQPDAMPVRSPIMAKPDDRYAIPNPEPEYDGIPDAELPVYLGHSDHLGYDVLGRNAEHNPSDGAYKTWARVVLVWAVVTFLLTAVLIWKHHFILAVILAAAGAVILGFCTPNRYMQEEFDANEWFTHRVSRVFIVGAFVGLPAFALGQLAGWLLGKLF